MAFAIKLDEARRLAVAHCDGQVLESEIHEAIDFSFDLARLPDGIDRIVLVEPTADLRALDAEVLHRIQERMLERSSPAGAPAFRSVLVTPSPFHRPIAELYKAIWDSHRLPGVEFWVVATPEEAARVLGLHRDRSARLPGALHDDAAPLAAVADPRAGGHCYTCNVAAATVRVRR